MVVDGKKIAEDILLKLVAQRPALPGVIRLGVLMTEGNAATDSFVRVKERVAARLNVTVVRELLSADTTTDRALWAAVQLARSSDGVIAQLPLPPMLDVDKIVAAIPPGKDPDALNPLNTDLQSPVAEAIAEILVQSGVELRGKAAAVLGAGRLVGIPAAKFLRASGAKVSIITHTENELSLLKEMDLVVLGAGNPGLVKPEMLKEGVILIDAGTSESAGKVVGDADPSCASVATIFTPVPGGVGPIAVAMLFKNLFMLSEKAQKERVSTATS